MYTRVEEFLWRYSNKDAVILKYCKTKYNTYASIGFNLLISSLLISLNLSQLSELAGYNYIGMLVLGGTTFFLIKFAYLRFFNLFDRWRDLSFGSKVIRITSIILLEVFLTAICFISLVARLFPAKATLDKSKTGLFSLVKRTSMNIVSEFVESSSQREVYLLLVFISLIIVLIPILTYLMTDSSHYFKVKVFFQNDGKRSTK